MMNLWKHLIFVLLCVFSAVSQAAWSVRYQHTDVLGSVIAESNAQGTITQRFGYKPFGEGSPTQKTGVGYTGHLEDTDLGLTYMQQRYYDPVIGRFYSNDPVGFSASNPMMFNRYTYANNNPYKYTDPDGRDPDRLSGTVAGAMLQMRNPAAAAQLASMTAAAGDSSYSAGVSAGIQLVEGASELANGASLIRVASNTMSRANSSGRLPDNALVCRGGSCTADKFSNGSGVKTDSNGTLDGVSVNSAANASLAQVSQGIPHGKLGVTTVGAVRAAGGDVVSSPTKNNPNHATMSGVTAAQAEKLMTPTVDNPNRKQ